MGIKQIFSTLGNSFQAILSGEFLLRLGFDRYFAHVLYCFTLIAAAIWMSLMIDRTLNQVERGRLRISELETIHTMDRFELEKKNSREAVAADLQRLGSDLKKADRPARILN